MNENDAKKATTIYEDVCAALTGSYGDGEETNSESSDMYTTNWDTEENYQMYLGVFCDKIHFYTETLKSN